MLYYININNILNIIIILDRQTKKKTEICLLKTVVTLPLLYKNNYISSRLPEKS